MSDVKNAKQLPQKFYAKHMQPGICEYHNETVLVDTEHMKKMSPSGIGKPVYVLHADVVLETLKEDMHGIISGSFYNPLDGWLWFEFMAIDDIAFQAIANGWAVSNAYIPTESGEGGEWHNCKYDREILNAEFTHMAIVPDPRYEGACILTPDEFKSYQAALQQNLDELQNSKSKPEGIPKMKFFKNKKEEVTTVDAETMVELKNGKTVSIGEMTAALEKRNAEDEKKEEEKKNSEQKVMVNGTEMSIDELMNAYCSLKNEKDEAEKKNAEDSLKDEDEKENASDDEEKDDGEKKNSKEEAPKKDHFKELKNAHTDAKTQVHTIETSMDMVARGAERYGSPKSK